MIDTDKYKGHTPAPWDVREAGINRIMVYTDDEGFAYEEANRNLVADAPLLLAEVERLHEVTDDLICDLEGFQEAVKEDEAGYKDLVASLEGIEEELKAEVERLREELRITQSNFSMVRNALANQYPEIEEAIWKVIE